MAAASQKLGKPDPEGGLTPAGRALSVLARGMRPADLTYKSYSEIMLEKGGDDELLDEDTFKALPVEEGDNSPDDDDEEEDTDDDDESEEEGEDMEKKKKAKKSGDVSVSDLMKSVEAYTAVEEALSESGNSRESFLQARLDSGTISKSERQELGRLWADEDEDDNSEALSKSVADVLGEDEDTSNLVDASDFLKSLVGGIDQRMDAVETEVCRDGRATRELLKAQGSLLKGLCNVIAEQDGIIKGLGDRVETVEGSPAPRRAIQTSTGQVVSRQLAKSVIGESNDDLTKGDIKSGLRTLMIHASEQTDDAAMDRITHATALFEQTGNIPQNVMAAIRQVGAAS
jgi:hypothetical protein